MASPGQPSSDVALVAATLHDLEGWHALAGALDGAVVVGVVGGVALKQAVGDLLVEGRPGSGGLAILEGGGGRGGVGESVCGWWWWWWEAVGGVGGRGGRSEGQAATGGARAAAGCGRHAG